MSANSECVEVSEALSARHDGEAAPLSTAAVAAHLATCASCREFERSLSETELARKVVARSRRSASSTGWWVLRTLLALVAIGYLVTAVPEMLFTTDLHHGHLAHHLGVFEASYGVMLCLIAVRPARARAIVPFTAVLAIGMVAFAVTDMANGRAFPLAESAHLLELAGLVLVWLLATRRGWPGRSVRGGVPDGSVASPLDSARAALRLVGDEADSGRNPRQRAS
jgi:predicted anti-sigma-YlaC factor YlaD